MVTWEVVTRKGSKLRRGADWTGVLSKEWKGLDGSFLGVRVRNLDACLSGGGSNRKIRNY